MYEDLVEWPDPHARNGDPSPKVVAAGPNTPLGDYKMRLGVGDGTHQIHGTNNLMAVGMAITHGCIRMYAEDVAALFPRVPVGTEVWLINDPVKGQAIAPDLDTAPAKTAAAVPAAAAAAASH